MAGERGAHGDIRGFFVADFADDEHLRVLSKQVPRGFSKIKAARLIHFCLHDARNDLLSRVFDGDNVASAELREESEAGVNGCGLAAAGGSGEQKQTCGLPQEIIEFRVSTLRELEVAKLLGGS